MNRLLTTIAGMLISTLVFGQVMILDPKEDAVTKFSNVSVTIAGRAGAEARLLVNEVETATGIIRIDGLLDFVSVEVPVGPLS